MLPPLHQKKEKIGTFKSSILWGFHLKSIFVSRCWGKCWIDWVPRSFFYFCMSADVFSRLPIFPDRRTVMTLLLMEEILHHLTYRNLVNNGINYLATGAGFLPSRVVLLWVLFFASGFPHSPQWQLDSWMNSEDSNLLCHWYLVVSYGSLRNLGFPSYIPLLGHPPIRKPIGVEKAWTTSYTMTNHWIC